MVTRKKKKKITHKRSGRGAKKTPLRVRKRRTKESAQKCNETRSEPADSSF